MPRSVSLLLLFTAGFCLAARSDEPAKPRANRLAKETSPYLLLHAHNPVDWYPWGPEAFARAKAENKPIFLSIGYSACYWCHVMERESFSDPAIARALNESFVCVKVDREERPDVDALYMAALQASTGSGGWPMSMFLLPDGRPFFGGTYFPPHDTERSLGFDGLIRAVQTAWRDKRALVETDAANLTEVVRKTVDRTAALARVPLSRDFAAKALEWLAKEIDPEIGGFGFSPTRPNQPKFPEPSNFVFLVDRQHRQPIDSSPWELREARRGLAVMRDGGIRDQLGGGYHRYSTKRDWSVPHFEKMLYDNAQLASVILQVFGLTRDPADRAEAASILDFIARDLTSPEGAYYSSLDAESEGEEGKSYVWTKAEVAQVLGEADAALFGRVHGLDRPPNFEKDRYVLLRPKGWDRVLSDLSLSPEALETRLIPMRAKLLAVRDKRPAPLRDDKILTGWNGLAIAAHADAARLLNEPRYRRSAERAADFVLTRLRTPEGRLLRTYRSGQAKLPGYLEDYAFFAHGLLRLHAATGDPKRLEQARAVVDRMILDFADPKGGGFFYTANDHESLLARAKDPADNAVPGANSVAIRALVGLARATKEPRYLDEAARALDAFSGSLARSPAMSPLMLVALDEYLDARPGAASLDTAAAVKPEAEPKPPGVVTGRAGDVEAEPGKVVEVAITLTIARGLHINANPTGVESAEPTVVSAPRAKGFASQSVAYPRGTVKTLAAIGTEKVAVYEGEVTIKARFLVSETLGDGPTSLPISIRYQACNDRACLAPATLEVPVKVVVRRKSPRPGPDG